MAIFSIWEGKLCGITLKREAGPPAFSNGELEDEDAKLIKVFEAASWNEACQIEYDHYGWGYYKPQDDWEVIE